MMSLSLFVPFYGASALPRHRSLPWLIVSGASSCGVGLLSLMSKLFVVATIVIHYYTSGQSLSGRLIM